MVFYPLPLTIRLANLFQDLSNGAKILFTPFFMIAFGISFPLDFLTIPFRWVYHDIVHLYSDMDELEWVWNR